MKVDWGFWVVFLLTGLMWFAAAWWLRGIVDREKWLETEEELNWARKMHPSTPKYGWDEAIERIKVRDGEEDDY